MTTEETVQAQFEEQEHDQSLQAEISKDSEKLDDLRLESESIASALEGVSSESIEGQNRANDLEKAATHSSGGAHEPATRIVTAVDWNGPDDPGNPLNWPLWKKCYHTAAIGSLAFAVTIGSSMITPATPEIAVQFGVSRTASILSLTLYVLGLALGPVIAAPISETFGRTVVYRVTGLAYILFTIGAGFSKSFASLLVCRLLAGICSGPTLAVGAGTSADMYAAQHRALSGASFIMMPFLGPALGPVIGGFVAQYKGWRWTQWCTIFITIFAYVLVLPMRETYKKIILAKRAKKLGIPGPPKSVKGWAWWKLLFTITLARPVTMLATEPMVLFLSLYNSFTFAVLFSFFAAYPYTFESVYDFNTWQYGLAFLGILIGVLLGAAATVLIDQTVYLPKYRQVLRDGKKAVAPEHRLYGSMIGAFCIPIGLFWFAWSARPSVHWISPVLAGIPFAFGNVAIFIAAAMFLIDVYGPLNGASAVAANGLARYTTGAVFPLFTFQMYERLGIDWATSLLAFISILMIPIPFVFFRFGPKIRARSGYETLKL